jgi:hypothetical protein
MSRLAAEEWRDANRRYLIRSLERLRQTLGAKTDSTADPASPVAEPWDLADPPALERLRDSFGLSTFERDILLMAAGVELDAQFAAQCAAASIEAGGGGELTLGLILARLDDAHWSALPPSAALRRWRLVRLAEAGALTRGAVRIDERILHYLVGVEHLDADIAAIARLLPAPEALTESQADSASQLAQVWLSAADLDATPLVRVLPTTEPEAATHIVAAASAAVGRRVLCVQAFDLPHSPGERAALARLLEREAVLTDSILVVDCTAALAGSPEETAATRFAASLESRVVLLGGAAGEVTSRASLDLWIRPASQAERREAWIEGLGPLAAGLNGTVDRLASQFLLGRSAIAAVAASVAPAGQDDSTFAAKLWESARLQSRRNLERLAERVESRATWGDLVLPGAQIELLRQVVVHVREQWRVFEKWGFGRGSARARGACALFSGPSGTGKTMAAEVLANELSLDLYRIDLSRVVSKYIGETEKNLDAIFQAGEAAGAILLFDEADALFGKRGSVQSGHDRYANLEVSYLLQRMESYRGGLAILTSNLGDNIDDAFTRRLRFIVEFPFPDAAQRAAIWRGVFPGQAPVGVLDAHKLSRLNIAGGHIRSIAVNAAFRAAEGSARIEMEHVIWAARVEYAKLGRPPGELAALDNG